MSCGCGTFSTSMPQGATWSRSITWATGLRIAVTGIASTNVLTSAVVALTNGQAVVVTVDGGLAGLIYRTYFVRDVSGLTFKLARTSGGAVVPLVTNGEAGLRVAVDNAGGTARMQLRRSAGATVALELTTENEQITLGGADGSLAISVDAVTTAALSPGAYAFDLELVLGESVYRILEGSINVTAEITV